MMPKLIALARRRTFGSMPFDRHAEHLRRGHGVDVEAFVEGLHELRDVGHVREHAQLDLAVVGGDELVALLGDEGAADAAAFLGADRDVLQVRLGRGEPAGGGRGERVVGVHPPRLRMDVAGERVGVGGFQLCQLPPVDDSCARSARPPAPRSSSTFTSVDHCPVLVFLPPGEPHLAVEDVAELFGGADVEFLARRARRSPLRPPPPSAQSFRRGARGSAGRP